MNAAQKIIIILVAVFSHLVVNGWPLLVLCIPGLSIETKIALVVAGLIGMQGVARGIEAVKKTEERNACWGRIEVK